MQKNKLIFVKFYHFKIKPIWYYIEIGWVNVLNFLRIKRDTTCIPTGHYCYIFNGKNTIEPDGSVSWGTDCCKYYRRLQHDKAACTYIGYIGWDICLADQCKICGENYGEETEEEKH